MSNLKDLEDVTAALTNGSHFSSVDQLTSFYIGCMTKYLAQIADDIDSCIFVDGDARCEGTVNINGDSNNLELEIYSIIKTFERECTETYLKAIERVVEDAGK